MITLKKSLAELRPYEVEEDQYPVKLDANEVPYSLLPKELHLIDFNPARYPDDHSSALRARMAEIYGVQKTQIMTGAGSGQIIENVLEAFCEREETILSFHPSFSMYGFYAHVRGLRYEKLEDFDYEENLERLIEAYERLRPKVTLLCNPNNPTGSFHPKKSIRKLLDRMDAGDLLLLDEAYGEFAEESMVDLIGDYPNLIVAKTLSKAYGLASLRLGFALAQEETLALLKTLRAPYSTSGLSERVALIALRDRKAFEENLKKLLKRREWTRDSLEKMGMAPYPSRGNFLFFEPVDPKSYEKLKRDGILVRQFRFSERNMLRVSIGSEEEMTLFIERMKEYAKS